MKYFPPGHEENGYEPLVATGKTVEEAEEAMRSLMALALIKHTVLLNVSPHADEIVPAGRDLSDRVR